MKKTVLALSIAAMFGGLGWAHSLQPLYVRPKVYK